MCSNILMRSWLDFVVTGEVADGYRYTGIECDVTSVPVEGLKSTLASLNTILVQDPSLNVEGATRDKLCTIDLNSYLPPNVNIVGMDEERIEVTLKVEALETENISVDGGRSECRCRQCVRTDRRCDRLKLTGEERKPW